MKQIVLTIPTVFAGAGTNNNVLSGQRIADLPTRFGTRFNVTYCSTASVAGFTEQIFVGNEKQPIHDSSVNVESAAGRAIVTRDDVVGVFEADSGEKLVVQVTAGGAGTHTCRVILTPIAGR